MALSDPEGILASPLTILDRHDDRTDVDSIAGIVDRNQVERVIVGLPRSMEGGIGRQAEKVQAFASELAERIRVPREFRDERLSTVSARRLMRQAGKRRGAADDAIAAALILQSCLDEAG